jgi:3-hydroxyisobutyrate dehydrogenase
MCANLVDHGVGVVAHDVVPSALELAVSAGATPAADLAELAAAVDVVILSLPTSAHVERVVLGPDGLIAAPERRTRTIVDTTSGDPLTTRRVAEAAAAAGVHLVDVGVSGGGRGGGVVSAREGTLRLMVGGDDDGVVDDLVPLLDVMGGELVRCGRSGNGHATKALLNLRAFAVTAVTTEVLVLGSALGLDVDQLSGVLGAPPVVAEMLRDPQRRPESGFALELASKDCDVAIGLAHAAGVTMMVATAAANAARAAARDEGPGADYHAVVDTVTRWSRRARGNAAPD